MIKSIMFSRHRLLCFDSDHDWNTGLELLKEMRATNIMGVCYATRQCKPGYTYIGKNDSR